MASVRRLFNELEQTKTPYGINLGTKHLKIKDNKAFKDAYAAAFKIFGSEAHHIIDLAWVDRTLGKAGRSPESRDYVINRLNELGIDTGNHPRNIAPQPQARPKYGRVGMAHRWVHDLYKQIPGAEDVFDIQDISELTDDDLVEYMVEAGRMRKQIVVDALNHKLDSLHEAVPESKNWTAKQVQNYANKNKTYWGNLGDETFQQKVKLPVDIPEVPGQPRGRIPMRLNTEGVFMGTQKGFLAVDPTAALAGGAKKLLKESPLGSAAGFAGALHDERLQEAVEEGDALKAGAIVVGDTALGATANLVAKNGAVSLAAKFPALKPALKAAAPIAGTVGGVATAVATAVAAPSSADPVIQERKNEEWRSKQTPEKLSEIDAYKDQINPIQNGNGKYGPDVDQKPDPFLNPHVADRQRAIGKALENGPRRELCLKGGNVCFQVPELGLSELFTGKFSGKEERATLNGSKSL